MHWAMQFVRNCLSLNQGNPWEHWRAHYRDAVSFRLIADSISDFGLGYVHWTEPDACAMLQEMCGRYASFVPPALRGVSAARCPDELKEGYQTLITLHERCVQLPTKVFALSFDIAPDDSERVLLSSMNAQPVGEFIVPTHGPLNPWQAVPQSSLRRAADGNLYMLQDFVAYYGEEVSHSLWERAAPCYDHRIDFVHENGDRIEGRTSQAL